MRKLIILALLIIFLCATVAAEPAEAFACDGLASDCIEPIASGLTGQALELLMPFIIILAVLTAILVVLFLLALFVLKKAVKIALKLFILGFILAVLVSAALTVLGMLGIVPA